MPRISPARLQDPLFVIVLAVELVTIAANVLVVASIIARIARGDRKAIRLRTGIAALNTTAAVLLILNTALTYAIDSAIGGQFESPLVALVGLGLWLQQLELWFTFTMLLSTDVRGTWTEGGEARARIVVVLINLVLLGPEYVAGSVTLTGAMLWSYVIISALLRCSKTLDAKASAEHHTLLIVTLVGSGA
ncbi:hypothetical protein HK105_203119 [Polyrhizophydium stewartii]|uniref:Uncharacterized protein n=1 Tax=Polyrhizophydium stewartii TaxID=2732419 RepID=A0ABR4ND57_9FUNG